MGLAAVPFGTAQAEDYEVRVRREEKPDAMHFKISVSGFVQPFETEIVWSHDKDYPRPLCYQNGFLRVYDDGTKKGK